MKTEAIELSRHIIAVHSKSFALASKLLPREERDRAVVVYAWCRRADDAVDLARAGEAAAALEKLRRELDAVYSDNSLTDPVLDAFRQVTRERRIPRLYPDELLNGLAMDVDATAYDDLSTLLLYSYRVAGTVGLMMCHVMGISAQSALENAAHLGVAMQLTNICRDVLEDWNLGRLYLPTETLDRSRCGWLRDALGTPFPETARGGVATATAELLDLADLYYRSGDAGVPFLSRRCALAVRTARRVYSAIGERIRANACDPLAGRVWTSRPEKLGHLARAGLASFRQPPRGGRIELPRSEVRAADILPISAVQEEVKET